MTESTAIQPSPPRCGAKLRGRDGTCNQPAGKNTDHFGQGKCWLHGGLTPIKTGRYSGIVRREISELIEGFEKDLQPLNILGELHIVRALLVDFLNRYEENRDAMLAWYASWNGRPWRVEDLRLLVTTLKEYEIRMREDGTWEEEDEPLEVTNLRRSQAMVDNMETSYGGRPREVLDISDAHRMAVEATKIVERIEKMRARGAVSREDFARVMTELGRTAEAALSPSRLRQILLARGVDVSGVEEVTMIGIADDLRNALSDLWMTIRVT